MYKKEIEISYVEVNGRYRCTYVNDYRVHGGKPYVSENQKVKSVSVSLAEMKNAGFVPVKQ